MQLNASRIKVLQAQDDIVNSMKESASKQLLRVSNNKKEYKKLLKDLIVQVIRQVLVSMSYEEWYYYMKHIVYWLDTFVQRDL